MFTSCLFFCSWFFLIFSLYLCSLPYLEMCTDHVNSTPTLLTTAYIMSILFLLSFPDFLVIFLLITILGNAHRPHNQYPNIVDNDLHLSLYFFLIFPDFLTIFTLITILGNMHRPWKLYLNIINKYTSCLSFFSWFFSLIFSLFLYYLPY